MRIITIMIMLLFSMNAMAQSFEQYKRQEQERLSQFKKQQEEGIARLRQEFAEYVEKHDKEFAAFLEREWKAMQTKEAILPPPMPKPVETPVYKPTEDPQPERPNKEEMKPLPLRKIQKLPTNFPSLVVSPPARKPVLMDEEISTAETETVFDFYGISMKIAHDFDFKITVGHQQDQGVVSKFWNAMNQTSYSIVVEQLLDYQRRMNLADFPYFLMIQKFSEAIYPGQDNGKTLLSWYLMLRSGYKVRLGTDGKKIHLLLPSPQMVYAKRYLYIDGQSFYLMDDPGETKIRTYENDYPGATKVIDFQIKSPMNIGNAYAKRELHFDYRGKSHHIKTSYDPHLVMLLKDYPQTELQVYFNSAVSRQAKESLAEGIAPLLQGMSSVEKAEFCLALVQHAFEYQTDPQQFGYEKFFFPEEVLHYPYSDCEDRSILYAYLVRDLIGLDVVGLQYSDHVATAVYFPEESFSGDYVIKEGKKFILADPTFIGAPVGKCMPQYLNDAPILISMLNLRRDANDQRTLWELVSNGGCLPGSNLPNLAKAEDGTAVLTGFYSGKSHFLGMKLPEVSGSRACFVGYLKSEKQPLWVKALKAEGQVVGVSLTTDDNANIYVAGTFSGRLADGPFEINSREGATDLFLASFDKGGQLRWLNKMGLDSISPDAPLDFSILFDSKGKTLGLQFSLTDDAFRAYGLFVSSPDHIVFNGNIALLFSNSVAARSATFASAARALSPDLIKSEADRLLGSKADPGIAGIIAVANLVHQASYTFTGKDAQAALDKYNPGFSRRFPDTYRNIGRIVFMKNENGLIILATENGKDVNFDMLRVNDKATLTITPKANGDVQFDILNGMRVGKAFVWFDLNMIRLFAESGDMLFDYDKDHTQRRLNIRRDFLN